MTAHGIMQPCLRLQGVHEIFHFAQTFAPFVVFEFYSFEIDHIAPLIILQIRLISASDR